MKFNDVCKLYYISSIMPRLNKILKERNISKAKLCSDLDIPYRTFGKHLNKKNPNMMTVPEFLLILDYLGITLEDL